MDKYADVEATGVGHAGTEADPYSYTDLAADVANNNPHTYHIKGTKLLNNSLFTCGNHLAVFQAWGTEPFRLRDDAKTNYFMRGIWNRCIIYLGHPATNFQVESLILISSYVQYLSTLNTAGSLTMKGSTIVTPKMFNSNNSAIVTVDSIIAAPAWDFSDIPP